MTKKIHDSMTRPFVEDDGAGGHEPYVRMDDGGVPAMGATTDAAASATLDEDATARTGISLWKGIKNILILIKAALGGGLPAALAAGGGLKVEGVAGGVAQPVSLATAPALVAGSATIGATTDAGPSWTSVMKLVTSADLTGAADVTDAPTAGQKIVIDDVIAASDTAMYIDFLEETSGTVIFRLYFSAGSSAQVTTRGKLKLPTADKKLRADASVAGNVAITVLFHSES